jgi:RimJ/RimL family protein N-acetyltransferase
MLSFHSDADVVRYIPWPVRDRAQTEEALELRLTKDALREEGDWLVLAIELRATGRVIGEVLLKWSSAEHQQGEIGFALHRDFHGQGLAREAATAMLDYGFRGARLHRIVGRCDARNTDSARLLTALGMRQEAHLHECEFFKGEWTDLLEFAVLDRDWPAG